MCVCVCVRELFDEYSESMWFYMSEENLCKGVNGQHIKAKVFVPKPNFFSSMGKYQHPASPPKTQVLFHTISFAMGFPMYNIAHHVRRNVDIGGSQSFG